MTREEEDRRNDTAEDVQRMCTEILRLLQASSEGLTGDCLEEELAKKGFELGYPPRNLAINRLLCNSRMIECVTGVEANPGDTLHSHMMRFKIREEVNAMCTEIMRLLQASSEGLTGDCLEEELEKKGFELGYPPRSRAINLLLCCGIIKCFSAVEANPGDSLYSHMMRFKLTPACEEQP